MLVKNQATIITAICLVGGAIIGYLMGDASFGLIVGFLISLGITGSYRKVSLTKANRRIIVGGAFTGMILVGIWFGLYTGDYLSGLGSAVAISFIIVLKMEKLFDERVGVLFNKASRDGFIASNLVLALFLYINRIYRGSQTLSFLNFNNLLLISIGLCWIVFLTSLLYHAYIKGE